MRSATALLVRDELVGFARSKVMIVLWLLMPALALLGFLLLPMDAFRTGRHETMTAATFMSVLLSSISGTVAALMAAVDLVTERNRNVYVMFAIRPVRRETIVWAKFFAVFACVATAVVTSLVIGIVADLVRGVPVTLATLRDAAHALSSAAMVIALSASVGVLFGVLARSVVVAVILVLYVGQNLAIVPMLPISFGVLPDSFWVFIAISLALVVIVMWLAGLAFRRAQL
jgi:ABC-type transport system involved in multi-copper enzyme maturation permease subunit